MAVHTIPRQERGMLASALVVTRRELRDSLKDWRIVTPTHHSNPHLPILDGFYLQMGHQLGIAIHRPYLG